MDIGETLLEALHYSSKDAIGLATDGDAVLILRMVEAGQHKEDLERGSE